MRKVGVADNIRLYSKRAEIYEGVHPEIFNRHEQDRLAAVLADAQRAVRSSGKLALDFGCGSGNLTRHLLELGFDVTCADVSPNFLRLAERRYGVPTIELTNGAMAGVPDASFDLIGLYSVLHHIPDYLTAVRELVGKLRPGGVLFLDHERNDSYWNPTDALVEFRRENAAARTGRWWDPDHKRWQHIVRAASLPSRHKARYRRVRRISVEGDIHVHPDDHIEWDMVVRELRDAGAEIVERGDYLQFVEGYDEAVWRRWRLECHDVSCVLARRTMVKL